MAKINMAEPHDKKMDDLATERCPYLRVKRGGDESMDYCDLVNKWCLLIHYDNCEVYNDFLKERVEETIPKTPDIIGLIKGLDVELRRDK